MVHSMGNLFNIDNGIFAFINKVCDLLFLSILWLLFCIPIITIGPATTALYYTTVKVIRRERGYLFREFMKSFRLNFKKGAIIGVLLTLAYTILFFDLLWAKEALNNVNNGSILYGIFIAVFFMVFCFTLYVFPVLSRFDMKLGQLIKAAAIMAIRHLPYTIVMVIVSVITIVAIDYILLMIFLLPAVATYINSIFMEKVLKKYIPASEGTSEETGKDEWYLE